MAQVDCEPSPPARKRASRTNMATVLWIIGASLLGVWIVETALVVLSYRSGAGGDDRS